MKRGKPMHKRLAGQWRRIGRYALCIALGGALGTGLAALHVRQGMSSIGIENGPWTTARGIGSEKAGMGLRAIIALTGLLALPEKEAIYFNAASDSEGDPLDGSCAYIVSGTAIASRWWSLTAYDADGYLIANDAGANGADRYSVGNASFAPEQQAGWQVLVAPSQEHNDVLPWIPVTADAPFELTLRAYHPAKELLQGRGTVELPRIRKLECVP